MNNGPSTEAWSAPLLIPGTIEATTSTGISTMPRDAFDQVTNENAQLSKEITELKQQMALLLQNQGKQPLQQQQEPKLQHTTPTTQSTLTSNTSIITPKFITLVAQAVQNIQLSNISEHKCSAPSNTEHPKYGGQMEQSFDSITMTPNER